ncbi:flagellar protein FliT [Dyella soli]|uniref:Flagellar protein FliT n=1 Tax=Dyella soli TaxID=522319 RepID=A0A4R0YF47_9GAMM|nr:flagellar protein FliT [Dyella soli]TCI06794.1 flagellar protein FliT [Dyella soli]
MMLAWADEILAVSGGMLAMARAGDWAGVTAGEAERKRLLQALPANEPALLGPLKSLLAHNEEIKALAGSARDDISRALGQHQQAHRALSTYLQAAVD